MAEKQKGAEQVFFDAERVSVVYKRVFYLLNKSSGAFFGWHGCNYLKVWLVLKPENIKRKTE
jgi:hypothetical protein